jgi:glycosyltransferase involved in cell wall biosynthesis
LSKQRILVFYDHFHPAYKAGGPVQSIVNLVNLLHAAYDFYIVCKPHEMNETELLPGITVNTWMNWQDKAKVYYWHYGFRQKKDLEKIIDEVKPSCVMINGIYSLYFNLLPLFYAASVNSNAKLKIILSARGMLHPGALSQKKSKKKLFLSLLRLFNINRKITWHATDNDEAVFIKNVFGTSANISIAPNIPNLLEPLTVLDKKEGELILGTVALISPMKNHLEVIRSLLGQTQHIQWYIYGPVKEESYWKECLQMMEQLPENIKIHIAGETKPENLAKALNTFQVFIMPSKSENFGHAILEALSAGKPVITTNTTPFKNLGLHKAGETIVLNELTTALPAAISQFADMGNEEYSLYCNGAAGFARSFVSEEELKTGYQRLFAN